jgi:hypothetical protein
VGGFFWTRAEPERVDGVRWAIAEIAPRPDDIIFGRGSLRARVKIRPARWNMRHNPTLGIMRHFNQPLTMFRGGDST